MRNLILLAATALAVGLTPAVAEAKPDKAKAAKVHASGKAHVKAHKGITDVNRNGIADWRERRLADANGNGIADWRERRMVDINNNGVADWRERWIDRDRDGVDDRHEAGNRWHGGACPPGLAKKNPPCIPPGQAKRTFFEGQRLSPNYRYYTDYDDIPLSLRQRHLLGENQRYIYRDNTIYVVDPVSRLITRILDGRL